MKDGKMEKLTQLTVFNNYITFLIATFVFCNCSLIGSNLNNKTLKVATGSKLELIVVLNSNNNLSFPTKEEDGVFIFSGLKEKKYRLEIQPDSESSGLGDIIFSTDIVLNKKEEYLNIKIPSRSSRFSIKGFEKVSYLYSSPKVNWIHFKLEKLEEGEKTNKFVLFGCLEKTKAEWGGVLFYIDKGNYRLSFFSKGKLLDKNNSAMAPSASLSFSIGDKHSIQTIADSIKYKDVWNMLLEYNLKNIEFNNTPIEKVINETNKKLLGFRYKLKLPDNYAEMPNNRLISCKFKELSLGGFIQYLYYICNIGNDIVGTDIQLKIPEPLQLNVTGLKLEK